MWVGVELKPNSNEPLIRTARAAVDDPEAATAAPPQEGQRVSDPTLQVPHLGGLGSIS